MVRAVKGKRSQYRLLATGLRGSQVDVTGLGVESKDGVGIDDVKHSSSVTRKEVLVRLLSCGE